MYRRNRGKKKQITKNSKNPRSSSLYVNLSFTDDSLDSEKNRQNNNNFFNEINDRKTTVDAQNALANVKQDLEIINKKDEDLNQSCLRIREAILMKTREIFDDRNDDFCSKTIEVLENLKETVISPKKCRLTRDSTIIAPRRTRATTARVLKQNSEKDNFFHELNDESINFEAPIMCSTFSHHCDIHESCNHLINDVGHVNSHQNNPNYIKIHQNHPNHVSSHQSDVDRLHIHQNLSVSSNPCIQETQNQVVPTVSPLSRHSLKPLITNIEHCCIVVDKVENGMKLRRNTIVSPESMDFTEVHGQILNENSHQNITNISKSNQSKEVDKNTQNNNDNILKKPRETSVETSESDFSLRVNTSLDPIHQEPHQEETPDDNKTINLPKNPSFAGQLLETNVSSLNLQEKNENHEMPICKNTTIFCKTINIINSRSNSVIELDGTSSVREVSKKNLEKDSSVSELKKFIEATKSEEKNRKVQSLSFNRNSLVEKTPEPHQLTASRSQKILYESKKRSHDVEKSLEKMFKDLDELEKTIILDQLSIPKNLTSRDDKGTVIIHETDDDSDDENSECKSEKNEDVDTSTKENVGVNASSNLNSMNESKLTQFRKRRKLFTQHSSPISLPGTPVAASPMLIRKPLKKRIRRRGIRKKLLSQAVRRSDRLSQHITQQKIREMNFNNVSSTNSSSEDEKLTQKIATVRNKKKRVIKSKKIIVKNPVKRDMLSVLSEIGNNKRNRNIEAMKDDEREKMERDTQVLSQTQVSRVSDDFMGINKIIKRRKSHNTQNIIIIATTGLGNRDKELVKNVVSKIAGAKIESVVTRKTTHVVTTGARTINLLRGIIRGCWIVKLEWVKRSMKAGRWLNAEKYEIDQFSKTIKENRRDREIFGSAYVSELFTTCGLIYIEENATPPREILRELIGTAGGTLTENRRYAKVIVGPEDIKEVWVLDSITNGELLPINQYKT